MQHFKGLDDLVGRLSASMPASVKHLQADIENNIKSGLESGLQKMNLVTREEFDIQTAVLLKTRHKIDALEKKIQQLEQQLDIHIPAPTQANDRTTSETSD
jgi:BMFP domain-containing protein YqiC